MGMHGTAVVQCCSKDQSAAALGVFAKGLLIVQTNKKTNGMAYKERKNMSPSSVAELRCYQ